jgi:hypothetical protein
MYTDDTPKIDLSLSSVQRARGGSDYHRRDRAPGPAQWGLDYPDTAAWIDRDPAPVSGLPRRSA